jgi:hypothetical protein
MIGAIIIAIVVVIVIPVGLFLTSAIAAGVIGTSFTRTAEDEPGEAAGGLGA